MLTRNTRIGNTPAWKNTFVNFQAPNSSAMHITEQISFLLFIKFFSLRILLNFCLYLNFLTKDFI